LNIAVGISSLGLSGDASQSTPTDQVSDIDAGCGESVDRCDDNEAERVRASVLI
jgi:hypothetical protein